MKRLAGLSLIAVVLVGLFAIGGTANAITNPLQYDNFQELADAVANFMFNIALLVAPILLVGAGFYFLTAAGNMERIITAKKIILYTLVGFAIILLSKGLVMILKDLLTGP